MNNEELFSDAGEMDEIDLEEHLEELEEEGVWSSLDRDIPLKMCFTVDDEDRIIDRLRMLGLPKLKHRWVAAQIGILAEAVRVHELGYHHWISYSRSAPFYTKQKRYRGLPFSLQIVTNVIDQASEYGLLENRIERPQSDRQSTFRATPELVNLFRDVSFEFVHGDVIRLRTLKEMPLSKYYRERGVKAKQKSRLIGYDDNADTNRMRREVVTINDFLSTVSLEWPGLFQQHEYYTRCIGKYQLFNEKWVLVSDLRIFRSFCRGSFQYGGRCYGWWQSQEEDIRANLLLNGEKVVEPDFSRLHPHMLYALRGHQLKHDVYSVPGFTEKMIKVAFLALINARTEHATSGAIRTVFAKKKNRIPYKPGMSREIIAGIKANNPLIADDICSDKGVLLMRRDSDIIVRTMLTLASEKIPFLPVHDSIICRVSDLDRVRQVMKESYETEFPGFTCPVG